jgi:hypothetical protein
MNLAVTVFNVLKNPKRHVSPHYFYSSRIDTRNALFAAAYEF